MLNWNVPGRAPAPPDAVLESATSGRAMAPDVEQDEKQDATDARLQPPPLSGAVGVLQRRANIVDHPAPSADL